MHVADNTLWFTSNNDANFRVGLESADPINDLNPCLLHFPAPILYSGLRQTSLLIRQSPTHIFRFFAARFNAETIGLFSASAIQHLLDSQDVWIDSRLFNETDKQDRNSRKGAAAECLRD